MLRYLLRKAMKCWQEWKLERVCFSAFCISEGNELYLYLNLLLYQTQISHEFRITKAMIKTIILTCSIFPPPKQHHYFRISIFLWHPHSSSSSTRSSGAGSSLQGWFLSAGNSCHKQWQQKILTAFLLQQYLISDCTESFSPRDCLAVFTR